MKKITSRLVTLLLIFVNVAIFLILEIIGDTEDAEFMLRYGAMFPTAIKEGREYWRLLTASFLHFGMMHVLNNMVILACAGPYLEKALGHVKYLLLYMVSAVGSTYFSYVQMCESERYAVSAGASGAIFAVIGGLLWVVIRNKGRYESLNAKGMFFMILISLLVGVSTEGVDNWSHVGGLAVGFLFSVLTYRSKPKKIDFNTENPYT